MTRNDKKQRGEERRGEGPRGQPLHQPPPVNRVTCRPVVSLVLSCGSDFSSGTTGPGSTSQLITAPAQHRSRYPSHSSPKRGEEGHVIHNKVKMLISSSGGAGGGRTSPAGKGADSGGPPQNSGGRKEREGKGKNKNFLEDIRTPRKNFLQLSEDIRTPRKSKSPEARGINIY